MPQPVKARTNEVLARVQVRVSQALNEQFNELIAKQGYATKAEAFTKLIKDYVNANKT